MPNAVNPEVLIELDKVRHLRFDLNAMAEFQDATGVNLMDDNVRNQLAGGMTLSQLRAILWACLVHEDETLTVRDVGKMITPENMTQIAEALNQATSAAMPAAKTAKAATRRPLARKSLQSS